MVEKDIIETKISEGKEKAEEKINYRKEKLNEKREQTKNMAGNPEALMIFKKVLNQSKK